MRTFTYNTFINTTPEKLWNALTSDEFTRQYWNGKELRSDWNVGSSIALVSKNGAVNWSGTVLTYDPHTSLSYTFDVSSYAPFKDEPISKVTYKLSPAGDTMMLTIIHEDLTEKLEGAVGMGWTKITSSLKSFIESGKALASTDF